MPFNLKRLSLYKNTAFFAIDKIKFSRPLVRLDGEWYN